ncbi:hypothetical protein ANANG_G00289500 [Anguilla anguilla]|uniref:Uncharacterized protein n=1 Tax=Anguilla anguilla TaxID=7936 RepID=A0A9D3RJ74_ANGAN|nr:hypothetical protein ANANG_G00289500 [Anguilla anguilla]
MGLPTDWELMNRVYKAEHSEGISLIDEGGTAHYADEYLLHGRDLRIITVPLEEEMSELDAAEPEDQLPRFSPAEVKKELPEAQASSAAEDASAVPLSYEVEFGPKDYVEELRLWLERLCPEVIREYERDGCLCELSRRKLIKFAVSFIMEEFGFYPTSAQKTMLAEHIVKLFPALRLCVPSAGIDGIEHLYDPMSRTGYIETRLRNFRRTLEADKKKYVLKRRRAELGLAEPKARGGPGGARGGGDAQVGVAPEEDAPPQQEPAHHPQRHGAHLRRPQEVDEQQAAQRQRRARRVPALPGRALHDRPGVREDVPGEGGHLPDAVVGVRAPQGAPDRRAGEAPGDRGSAAAGRLSAGRRVYPDHAEGADPLTASHQHWPGVPSHQVQHQTRYPLPGGYRPNGHQGVVAVLRPGAPAGPAPRDQAKPYILSMGPLDTPGRQLYILAPAERVALPLLEGSLVAAVDKLFKFLRVFGLGYPMQLGSLYGFLEHLYGLEKPHSAPGGKRSKVLELVSRLHALS